MIERFQPCNVAAAGRRGILRCAVMLSLSGLVGCSWWTGAERNKQADRPLTEPLLVQQSKAYPETATGQFLSLVDFEDSFNSSGREQVGQFSISPAGAGGTGGKGGVEVRGSVEFVVNQTRTGSGAIEAMLYPGEELVLAPKGIRDFSGYCLLSLAVYSNVFRDDLRVTLTADGGSWQSHRALLKPGWNTVLLDIQRLAEQRGFDISNVRSLRIAMCDSAGPVIFGLDDVMLVQNERPLLPSPQGASLSKRGLSYRLEFAGQPGQVALTESDDGLWRLGADQPMLQIAPPGAKLPESGESLDAVGARRIGQAELLEQNLVRVRLASQWYFPTRAGEWVSLAVRGVRWEYTFYPDGRMVAHVELNNAGGDAVGEVRLLPTGKVAWATGQSGAERSGDDSGEHVTRWDCLSVRANLNGELLLRNYCKPGRVQAILAEAGARAPGDADGDGFDESQGCYFLRAKAGQCRFVIHPPEGGLLNPVFRVDGGWQGDVAINSEGRAIRDFAVVGGQAVFRLSGLISRPTSVEVSGSVATVR